MNIRVLFFASARELVGLDEYEVQLPSGSDTTALLQALYERWPLLEAHMRSCVLALNQEFVEKTESPLLQDGNEVAIIPPISGG